jgi:transcriptional regulator with XRE-family HTH domain
MDVAERLAALRKRAGLSQGDVAERLNVSRQAVSRWETGFTVPSTDNLSHLGRLYGVTLDELLSYSAALPPEKPQEEAPAQQPKAEAPAPTPQPAAASAPAHARAIIIALSILCLLLAIGVGVLLHQKHSENRELTFDEIESESIEDADIDEFQFG